jgi:hypothetical protein
MKKLLSAIFLCLIVVGCATPYQPKSFTGGFEDIKLGQGKYEITFHGNGYINKPAMQNYNKKRSAEICRNGFDIINENFDVPKSWGPIKSDGFKTLVTIIQCK